MPRGLQMQDAVIAEGLAGADQALQQLRDLSQALEARLRLRQQHAHDTALHADSSEQCAAAACELAADRQSPAAPAQIAVTSTDQYEFDAATSGSEPTEDNGSQLLSYAAVPGGPGTQLQEEQQEQLSCSDDGDDAGLQSCSKFTMGSSTDSTAEADTSATGSELGSSKPAGLAPAPAKQVPAWKQHAQQEQQMLQARQKQAAAEAAARNKKQLTQQEAVSWQMTQQQLPFQVQHSHVSSGVTHKLQKSLSTILRDAANRQQAQEEATVSRQTAAGVEQHPAAAQVRSTQPLMSAVAPAGKGSRTAAVDSVADDVVAAAAAESCSGMVDRLPGQSGQSPKGLAGTTSSSSSAAGAVVAGQSVQGNTGSLGRLTPRRQANRRISNTRPALTSSSSKHQAWAAADAQTDAEVNSFLLDHWQQHHMATAALVLQCAWRSRVARLGFGRYLSKRHAGVHAILQSAFLRWRSWTKAAAHHRCYQLRAALQAWQELLQLQTQLCLKVLQGLKGGALGGDMPPVVMWRMCTSQQGTKIKPSLGGMLASILLHRVPRMRQKECLLAWRQLTRSQALLRLKAHRMLTAVLRQVELQRLRQAVRFWRLHTACCICERLQLQLPTFPHSCDVFDAWLWRHERRLYTQQQAVGLSGRLAMMRCLVRWHSRVHKMRVMRIAWSGVLLHSRHELLRGGMSAFKANWREEQLHRRMVTAALLAWRDLMDRNKAVAAVRSRILDVAEARHKMAGLAAFKRFCKMSQLLSAAAVLKQWQARPLAQAHIHAWLHDTLHATFYLCWWRWRRRAEARLQWRASLGLHMYRAHWLNLELVFSGWRKVAAAAKQQQDPAADPVGTEMPAQQETLQLLDGSSTLEALPADGASDGVCDQAAEAEGCPADEDAMVHVTLADYPVSHPWRPLLQRAAVLAPQGLRRATGLRLGRAVKDLRELEGSFIVKDSDGGAGGLLCSRVFARAAVSPGLNAMATAQLPMNLLWRKAFPADKFWWQRVVGLAQHQVPHPDSWRSLISCPHSRNSSSSSQHAGTVPPGDLQDFLSSQYSSAAYKCTCSRCPHYVDPQATVVTEVAAKPAVDAAALMARARLRLRAAGVRGIRLNPLQVPSVSIAASTAAASPTAATPVALDAAGANSTGSSSAGAGGSSTKDSLGVAVDNSSDGERSGAAVSSSSSSSSGSVWPVCWSCEDVAVLCGLAQAEELLETAVHLLLGVGADSSAELYEKLQQMTRGTQRPLQGDLLAWLLSAALVQDSAHACTVLARARARDELLVATMELRERAMALHLHIPHKFTLNTKRVCVNVRASWTGIISRVEQERDWEASSADDDAPDPQELLWASLLAQQPQQQLQWLPTQPASANAPLSASGRPASAAAAATQATQTAGLALPQLAAATESAQQSGTAMAQQVGQGRLSTGPDGAQAAVMALAAAAAGPRAKLSAAQEHLAPGMMLAQSPLPAGEVWASEHVSSSHATGPVSANQPQSMLQQQLDTEQQAALQQQQKLQEEAKQKQQKQQKQAKATAQGLFGSKSSAAAAAGSRTVGGKAAGMSGASAGAYPAGAAAAYGEGQEAEIFTGPDFLPIASLSSLRSGPVSDRSKASTSRSSAAEERAMEVDLNTAETSAAAAGAAGSSAAQSPVYSSTQGPAAQPVLSAPGDTTVAAADIAPAAATDGTDELLKSELEHILTDLLAPLLPSADVSTCGPAGWAPAEGGPGVDSAVASAGPDSAGPGSDVNSSILQGARSAAQCLAGACVEWVLQPALQQQQQQQLLLPPDVLAKPLSAPCGLHSELLSRPGYGESTSNSRSNTSSADTDSKAAGLQLSFSRRAASAAAVLQSARAAVAAAPSAAAEVAAPAEQAQASDAAAASSDVYHQQYQPAEGLDMDSIGAAGSFCLGDQAADALDYGQEASWLALAVQQGLLDPAQARTGWNIEAQHAQQQQQQRQYSQAGQQQQGDPGDEALDLDTQLEEQSSGQEPLSSCSSLPSIPSAQGFWTQQQAQQAGRASRNTGPAAAGKVLKGAGEDSHLPLIASAAAKLFRSSAPGGPISTQQIAQQQQQQERVPATCMQEHETHELLPQVATALQALQTPQQQPGSTQQQLLEGMQHALSLLEPAQLQQQVQLLLQAQRTSAAAHAQQQQQHQQHEDAVRILPWGGEMQPARPAGAGFGSAQPAGVVGAAAVLSNLLTASLSTRVAFWRQVTIQKPQRDDVLMHQEEQQQQTWQQHHGFASMASSSPLSDQLHQLAWSSILISSSTKRQRQQEQRLLQQQQQRNQQQSGMEAGPMAELKQKLHTYLAAHMQWRQQQQYAPPLQPAEKWVTLEHEEQVLEFITSMTLAVHQQLLRKHLGLPPAEQRHSSAAFGSSASRDPAATAAAAASSQVSTAPDATNIKAVGSRVDMSDARCLAPTAPRRVPARVVPCYIIPRPDARGVPQQRALGTSRPSRLMQDRLEPLQGWQTTDEHGEVHPGLPGLMPAGVSNQRGPGPHWGALHRGRAALHGAGSVSEGKGSRGLDPSSQGSLRDANGSFKSSESSWAG